MIKKGIIVILALILAANTIHLNHNQADSLNLPAGKVYLRADNGQYLGLCHNCGRVLGPFDPASTSSNASEWTLEVVGQQVALKATNGNYLLDCYKCWALAYSTDQCTYSAFAPVSYYHPSALWIPTLLPNGKYVFKSKAGKYLGRYSSQCGYNVSDFVFQHTTDPSQPQVQWDVIYTHLPKLGTVTIQADNGNFLKLCPTCGGIYPSAASVENGSGAQFQWNLTRVGLKLAIQGSNGNYLSRCNQCWNKGLYLDAAFVYANNSDHPYSQWAPVKQQNGKWTFQADTGKYLARCKYCAQSSSLNLAFVHSPDPNEAWAQWTLAEA